MQEFINKWSGHEFSTGSYGYEGTDYLDFQQKYKTLLKKLANTIDANLVKFDENHYCFNASIERNGRLVHLSIPDVRGVGDSWKERILYWSAEAVEQHYYTSLENLAADIDKLLNKK